MNPRTLRSPWALALLSVFAVGCHCDRNDSPRPQGAVTFPSVPASIGKSFTRDHPGAFVTAIQKQTDNTGVTRYAYTFTDAGGKSQTVEYTTDGQRLDEH